MSDEIAGNVSSYKVEYTTEKKLWQTTRADSYHTITKKYKISYVSFY